MPLDEYYVNRVEQNAEDYRRMMLREYIPVMLATEFLGVTRPTIIKLIREGKLRSVEQHATMVSTTDLARMHEQRAKELRKFIEELVREEYNATS